MALPIQATPTYVTVLPVSGFEVEYRPFLVKEQNILVQAKEGDDAKRTMQSVKKLLQAVTNDSIVIEDLPTTDMEWLFIQVRKVSVGETSKLMFPCGNTTCSETADLTLNLDDIRAEGEVPEDETVMITDKVGLTLSVPTVSHVEDIAELDEQNQAVELIKQSIVNIFDEEQVYEGADLTREERNEFVDSLTFPQLELLGGWYDGLPKLTHTIEWTCAGCGEENKTKLEGIQNFF
jgi:hypothetical protein|tara:strand:- start:1 stop:705 length:705 start_codon:yes stop_codon:yes gene_type:complete